MGLSSSVTAINFDLMSRQEQDAVEYSYQSFLNSLHFPIQIIIRSQKIDLDHYIETLNTLRTGEDNELLGMLMEDYIANIKGLVEEVNIMNKQFYVVVPFFPPVIARTGFASSLGAILKAPEAITVNENDFAQFKTELTQRVALVASGLNQMGIRAIPLNTQELIDLYYSTYNPDTAVNQKLIDASQLQYPAVTRSDAPPMPAPATTTVGSDLSVAPNPSPLENNPVPVQPVAVPEPAPVFVPEPTPAPAPVVAPTPMPEPVPVPAAPEPMAAPAAPEPSLDDIPIPLGEPLPLTPTPTVSQQPAVNPTAFDPYNLQSGSGDTTTQMAQPEPIAPAPAPEAGPDVTNQPTPGGTI
jgi:hypothetical protein